MKLLPALAALMAASIALSPVIVSESGPANAQILSAKHGYFDAPTATQNGYFVNLDAIPMVQCEDRDEKGELVALERGTGAIIGHDRVLTAAHVVHGTSDCAVRGHRATVSFEDTVLDVAVLTVDLGDTPVMPISCDSFVKGQTYFSIGYAQGQDFAMQVLTATGDYANIQTDENVFPHGAMFDGRIFSGMSGGPVIDNLGRVTGINVAGNQDREFAAIRDLADTPLCTMLKSMKVSVP